MENTISISTLKELLGSNSAIIISIQNEELKSFLEYAKKEGCIWQDGRVIHPTIDKPHAFQHLYVVNSNLTLSAIPSYNILFTLRDVPKYDFSAINDSKEKEQEIIKNERAKKSDEEFETAMKALELRIKRRKEENRRISELQLKHREIAQTLPKQFYVRYENEDDLLRLNLLFKEIGYDDVHDVMWSAPTHTPKVFCVDNSEMCFFTTNITCCACAMSAKKKFYTTEQFEKMMRNIFKEENKQLSNETVLSSDKEKSS